MAYPYARAVEVVVELYDPTYGDRTTTETFYVCPFCRALTEDDDVHRAKVHPFVTEAPTADEPWEPRY